MSQDNKTRPSAEIRAVASCEIGATAGGGLLFGVLAVWLHKDSDRKATCPPKQSARTSYEHSDTPAGLARDAFIRIDRAGIVTLMIHKVEMGQAR